MTLSNKDAVYLFNFFGNNDVCFRSKEHMINSFEILHYVSSEGIVFWKLKPNAKFADIMGSLKDAAYSMKDDNVYVFCTHGDDGKEHEVLENWCEVPIAFMNTVENCKPDIIRNKIEEYCKIKYGL